MQKYRDHADAYHSKLDFPQDPIYRSHCKEEESAIGGESHHVSREQESSASRITIFMAIAILFFGNRTLSLLVTGSKRHSTLVLAI